MARGRKRKTGPREPNGKPQRPEAAERREGMRDRGTPEVQAKRFALYGTAEPGDEVTPRELICPLARIRHRMTDEQLWAAQAAIAAYGRYCAAIGIRRLNSNSLQDFVEGSRSNPMPDDDRMNAVERYNNMITAVRLYSRRGELEVKRLMHGTPPRDLSILLPALTALAQYLGMFKRKAA